MRPLTPRQPDDNTGHAAITHDQVRADADRQHRHVRIQLSQKRGEIVFVRREENRIRRAADSKPGKGRQRFATQKLAAHLRKVEFTHC